MPAMRRHVSTDGRVVDIAVFLSDAHAGLADARRRHFPGTLWQRCQRHLLMNALEKPPKALQDMLHERLRTTNGNERIDIDWAMVWQRTERLLTTAYRGGRYSRSGTRTGCRGSTTWIWHYSRSGKWRRAGWRRSPPLRQVVA